MTIRSLQLPLDELKHRLARLDQQAGEAQRRRASTGDMLGGEERRVIAGLYQRGGALQIVATDKFKRVIEQSVADAGARIIESAIRETLAGRLPRFFDEQFASFTRDCQSDVTALLQRYRRQSDEWVEAVRKDAADAFGVSHRKLPGADALKVIIRPHWATYQWFSSFGPVSASAIDWILPLSLRRARIRRRIIKEMEFLVIRNVGSLRLRTREAVEEVFRDFKATLRTRLQEVTDAIRNAASAALGRQQQDQNEAAPETAHLSALTQRLAELSRKLDSAAQVAIDE